MTRTKRTHRNVLLWTPALILLIVTIVLRVGGDLWWPVLPFLFGPRWPWAFVLAPLVLVAMRDARSALVPLSVGLLILGYGVLGFRIGLERLAAGDGRAIRIMTYNVARNSDAMRNTVKALASLGVDVAMIVECPSAADSLAPTGWTMRAADEICVFSRLPILSWIPHPRLGRWRPDGNDAAARLVIDGGDLGRVTLGVVHLETARDALSQFFDISAIFQRAAVVDSQTTVRRNESAAISRWIGYDTATPMIVTGDFNLTVESRIYRRYWSRYRNAFDHAGIGTGHTWRTRWHGVRIDHILFNERVQVRRAFIGPDLGSDHRPLVADLVIPGGQRTTVAR